MLLLSLLTFHLKRWLTFAPLIPFLKVLKVLSKTEFKVLLSLATKQLYFLVNRKLYKQLDGMAMGSPFGLAFSFCLFFILWKGLLTKLSIRLYLSIITSNLVFITSLLLPTSTLLCLPQQHLEAILNFLHGSFLNDKFSILSSLSVWTPLFTIIILLGHEIEIIIALSGVLLIGILLSS